MSRAFVCRLARVAAAIGSRVIDWRRLTPPPSPASGGWRNTPAIAVFPSPTFLFTFYISHTVKYNIITHNKHNHQNPEVSLNRRPVWPSRDGVVPRHMPSRPGPGESCGTFGLWPLLIPRRVRGRMCEKFLCLLFPNVYSTLPI